MAKTATTPKTTEVAKVETGGALAVPDWMKNDKGLGGENLDSGDLVIPRLALLQAVSDEVATGLGKTGEFFHKVSEEVLGEEVPIIVILCRKSYILWNPREAGGGILARADDGVHWNPANAEFDVKLKGRKEPVKYVTADTVKESGLAEWGSTDPDDPKSAPAATLMYNYLVVVPTRPDLGLMSISLSRSQVSVAKDLNSKLSAISAPYFAQKFVVKSVDAISKAGDKFKNFKFVRDGLVQDKGEYDELKHLFEKFRDASFSVDVTDMQKDEDTDSAAEAAPSGEKF